jgi:hypothetical protein
MVNMHKQSNHAKKEIRGPGRTSLLVLHTGVPLIILHMAAIALHMYSSLDNPGYILYNCAYYLEYNARALLLIVLGSFLFELLEPFDK